MRDPTPVRDQDYRVTRRPYFNTPVIIEMSCIRCPYNTGRAYTPDAAMTAFLHHWGSDHAGARLPPRGNPPSGHP